MKKGFLSIYRCIVGAECGFSGEGNEQWYYSLALVINLMLIWWKKPEIAVVFTILAVIHYATVCVYGLFELIEDGNVILSYAYFSIHAILAIVAICVSSKWAVITALIVIIAFLFAPDCTRNNIVIRKPGQKGSNVTLRSIRVLPLVFNTIIFAVFVCLDFLLPIDLWTKLFIIAVAIIVHPIIDSLEGEGIIISDVTSEAFDNIRNHLCKNKK